MTAPPHSHADDLACIDVVEMVTDHLEGIPPAGEERRLERHLETCRGCTEYVEQIRAVAAWLEHLRAESISAEMRDDLRAAFRAARER